MLFFFFLILASLLSGSLNKIGFQDKYFGFSYINFEIEFVWTPIACLLECLKFWALHLALAICDVVVYVPEDYYTLYCWLS